jgi:predicted Zn-dependent protease
MKKTAFSSPETHRLGCLCALHQRRRFTTLLAGGSAGAAALALPSESQAGGVGSLVPAEDVEAAAAQQYQKLLQQASSQRALAPDNHPQVIRLRAIAQRLIPLSYQYNSRARDWRWEVNLIASRELNAFCMPGGKIAFFYGLLQQLQLTDDEVAMVMGHEMTHALREHGRKQMGEEIARRAGIGILSTLLGWGNTGRTLADMGTRLVSLRFSRADESEADLIGMELAARAGYDPHAGVTLWTKMMAASKGAPPEFLSTHPASDARIREIEANMPNVEPIYARAQKPPQRFEPPAPRRNG